MLEAKHFREFISRAEIDAMVADLAQKINQDYEGKAVTLVAVLKGSVIFAADLIRHLTVENEIDFVRITRAGRTDRSKGTISMVQDLSIDLKGKHVLMVEQTIDSARGSKFIYDRLMSAEPASLEIVTLLDKPNRRKLDLPMKYIGRKIDDHFLVGYGLDLEERCRHMGEIFYLQYPN